MIGIMCAILYINECSNLFQCKLLILYVDVYVGEGGAS